jgi:hypothetical protein
MSFRRTLPTIVWLWRAFTGPVARRICLVIVLVPLVNSAVVRTYSYFLSALSKLERDNTSEEDVVRTVPYLVRWQWEGQLKRTPGKGDIDAGIEPGYSATPASLSAVRNAGLAPRRSEDQLVRELM